MISIENISRQFKSGRGVINAVNNLTLKVEDSSNVVLFGKSGSGKTTLLNCIGGLDRPDKGSISVSGVDIHSLSEKALSRFQRSRLGFIFQHSNLLNYLTVSQNIAFPMELNGFDKAKIKKRVHELLDITGLKGIDKAMPDELSGGEAQRVAFARAVAHKPDLILADEPTASLDTETGKELIRFMFDTGKDTDSIFIIATHDKEIMNLADEKFQMKDGEVRSE